MSELTLYPKSWPMYRLGVDIRSVIHSYRTAVRMLGERVSFSSTQMALLMEPAAKEYDLVRIANSSTDVCKLVNNHDGTWSCDRTDRKLRDGNDFYRLWRNGEFDLPGEVDHA